MPSLITDFFKAKDDMGSGISLNYRGEATYGTILGGCLSMALTLYIAAFILL